jgi:glycosyltransferase involved in cell wall biosynthesis
MDYEKLIEVYNSLLPNLNKVYVVPLINFERRNSDYLYLLYKYFLEKDTFIKIESLSAAALYKPFIKKLSSEKNLLHYHWFEVHDFKSLLGIIWKLFWILAYKFLGGKIVWTVHNKFPHSNNYKTINKIFRKVLANIADKLHVHCNDAINIMSEIFRVEKNKFFVIRNPEYPVIFISAEKAKIELHRKYSVHHYTDKKIFLMFGAIADYKGIAEAAELFKNNYRDKILLIAGMVKKWDESYFKKLIKVVGAADNIIVIRQSIPDEDVNLFFNAADYILFNYKNILTSAGVLMALSYRKKIIAPALGCIKELEGENFTKYEPGNLKNILASI